MKKAACKGGLSTDRLPWFVLDEFPGYLTRFHNDIEPRTKHTRIPRAAM